MIDGNSCGDGEREKKVVEVCHNGDLCQLRVLLKHRTKKTNQLLNLNAYHTCLPPLVAAAEQGYTAIVKELLMALDDKGKRRVDGRASRIKLIRSLFTIGKGRELPDGVVELIMRFATPSMLEIFETMRQETWWKTLIRPAMPMISTDANDLANWLEGQLNLRKKTQGRTDDNA